MADNVAPAENTSPAPDGASAGGATGSAAPTREKELRDRLAALGRRSAQLEQVVTQQNAALQGVQYQLGATQQAQAKREQEEFEARLSQMRPEEAAEARSRYTQQIAMAAYQNSLRAATPPPAPAPAPRQYTAEEIEQERTRKSAEILAEVNQHYGLPADAVIRADDLDDTAWRDPESFRSAAATAARLRTKDPSVQSRVVSNTPEGIRDQIKRDVLRELGVSGSLSAEPAGGANQEPGNTDVARLAGRVDPHHKGMGASLAELKKFRSELAGRVPRE